MICYVNLTRTFIVTLTLLTIDMISAATAIRHFKSSPKYLDYSEIWSNMKFGVVILALSLVATIWSLAVRRSGIQGVPAPGGEPSI